MHADLVAYVQTLATVGSPLEPNAGLVAELDRLERRAAVRRCPMLRGMRELGLGPEAAWLYRYAIARALAHRRDSDMERAFPAWDAIVRTEGRAGSLATVLAGECGSRGSLFARGVVVEQQDGKFVLARGVETWAVSGRIDDPWVYRITVNEPVSGLAPVAEAAARLARAVDLERPIVLRSPDPALAASFAAALARARRRPLRAWRWSSRVDADPLAALLLSADTEGADVLLTMPETYWRDAADARPGVDLSARRSPGALLWCIGPDGNDPYRLSERFPTVDLEPLARTVAPLLPAAILAGAAPPVAGGATVGELERVARSQAAHLALYPDRADTAASELLATVRATRRTYGDEADEERSAAARWETPTSTLDGLVLAATTRRALDGVVDAARAGRRSVALLHGPPGTGKSHAARCIAGSLGRKVCRLEAAAVRDMFFGEEEKNLAAVFAAVEREGGVLVVDEADAWVGRREGSSAARGGARITESTEMLLHLERFEGVAVLTTNRPQVLDPALFRRVDAWIAMPLPGPLERMALWTAALGEARVPGATELLLLAAIPLSGGDIEAAVREARMIERVPSPRSLLAAARRRSEHAALLGD